MEHSTKYYNRNTASLTISQLALELQLSKYVFNPPYQRRGDVWLDNQKSFLLDSIMKNYPIPPIFLETIIDNKTGQSNYNVIDGKQRLLAIKSFIDGKVKLPKDFSNDGFGHTKMDGKNLKEIQKISETDKDVEDILNNFWRYVITIEYISRPSSKIVENIFDRINRGGKRLNTTEMVKSQIFSTYFYDAVERVRNERVVQKILKHVDITRLEDLEVIIDLGLYYANNKLVTSSEKRIISEINKIQQTSSFNSDGFIKEMISTFKFLDEMRIDFDKFKLSSTGHFLAICIFAYTIKEREESSIISQKLNDFYKQMRSDYADDDNTLNYFKSMQAGTKQVGNRKKRINAMLEYCELTQRVK